ADGDWKIFSLRVESGVDVREEIFRLANARHWTVRELTQRRATLEDVFVELTHPDVVWWGSIGVMAHYETELRNKNRGYMKLIVRQKAIQLFEPVWRIAFIEHKIDFKLRAQLADAAQSVSANIPEGYGRCSIKE